MFLRLPFKETISAGAWVLLLLGFLEINAQDSTSVTVKPKGGRIKVDEHTIPIFKGAKEVEVIREANQIIRIRYNMSVPTADKMFKDFEKIKKFYSGATIFGVTVDEFDAESPSTFKVCNSAAAPSLHISVGPQSGAYINFVEIANKCYGEIK